MDEKRMLHEKTGQEKVIRTPPDVIPDRWGYTVTIPVNDDPVGNSFAAPPQTPSLCPPQTAVEQIHRERRKRLGAAMEAANLRHCRGNVRDLNGSKVAFNRVPDHRDFDDLTEKPSRTALRKTKG